MDDIIELADRSKRKYSITKEADQIRGLYSIADNLQNTQRDITGLQTTYIGKFVNILEWTLTKYYEHQPQTVINLRKTTIFLDETIFTDRTIMAKKPDTIIHDKEEQLILIIDIAVSDDLKIIHKEEKKLNKRFANRGAKNGAPRHTLYL